MIEELDSVEAFNRRELERLIMLKALAFVNDVKRWSKTSRAFELRLDVALYMISGSPTIEQLARRHRVSERRVRQATKELRRHLRL